MPILRLYHMVLMEYIKFVWFIHLSYIYVWLSKSKVLKKVFFDHELSFLPLGYLLLLPPLLLLLSAKCLFHRLLFFFNFGTRENRTLDWRDPAKK